MKILNKTLIVTLVALMCLLVACSCTEQPNPNDDVNARFILLHKERCDGLTMRIVLDEKTNNEYFIVTDAYKMGVTKSN